MNWTQLLSGKRFGMEEYHERKHERTDFQRDYDRFDFLIPFRRLQNKTQVFPFREVSLYITDLHSLEVSCVGRSLGNNVAKGLMQKISGRQYQLPRDRFHRIQPLALPMIWETLHSGIPERAISAYFFEGNGRKLEEKVRKERGTLGRLRPF